MNPSQIRTEARQFLNFFYSTLRHVLRPKALFQTTRSSPVKKLVLDVVVLSLCSSLLLILVRAILTSEVYFSSLFSVTAFLILFSIAFSLIFVGVFAFSKLPFKQLVISSLFFSAHSVITLLLPSFVVLLIYITSEHYLIYYLYYIFIYVPFLVFVFVYPLIFNRGIYKILSLLISVACFTGTNLVLSIMLNAAPSEYDNTARYIYDPILRESVGNDLLNEGKSLYINKNSAILIDELKKLTGEYEEDTISKISAQIGSITNQKDQLSRVLSNLHFRRNKKTIELNLHIVQVLELINIQVNRLEPLPHGYADTLRNLDLQQKEISKELDAESDHLRQHLTLQQQYKEQYQTLLEKSKTTPTGTDVAEASQLIDNMKILIEQIENTSAKVENIKARMAKLQSEIESAARYRDRMRINTNAVEEINHLLGVLNSDVRRGDEYMREQSRIIQIHSSLWFIP